MPVVNIADETAYDLYIGPGSKRERSSIWASPYGVTKDMTRERALGCYYWHLYRHPELIARLSELRGRTLACRCAPFPCHGHLLEHLAAGHAVPQPDTHRFWVECQQCGAPAYFWRETVGDPSNLLLAGFRMEELDARFFTYPNGTAVHQGGIVGCLVCQTVGAYMMKWRQHRQGVLAEVAERAH